MKGKGKAKANGVSGAGDGEVDRVSRSHDEDNKKKNGSSRGVSSGGAGGEGGSESDSAQLATGRIEGSKLSAVEELQQAMASGKSKGGGLEVSPKKNEAGERGVAGDPEVGGMVGPSQARRMPLTVFTRDEVDEDPYNPLLYGCRSVENYYKIDYVDEGAYGKVYCALNKNTGQVVALKQVGFVERLRLSGRE